MSLKKISPFVNFICAASLLGASLVSAGCATRVPMLKTGENTRAGLSFVGSGNLEYVKVHVGDKAQTTPTHPADTSFLHGDTTTDLKDGFNASLGLGLEANVGYSGIDLVAGVEETLNPMSLLSGYRNGIYDVVQQSSDTRGGNGSFAYSQLLPGFFKTTPYIGIEAKVGKSKLGLKAGIPITSFKTITGFDRWGGWEEYTSSDWSGNGRMFTAFVNLNEDEDLNYGIGIRYEKFNPEFEGEDARVESYSAFVNMNF